MKKIMEYVCATAVVLCAGMLFGMPSLKEISEVQPLVSELMKPSVTAYKARKMSGSEVGDKALSLAESASTEAAVFLCMKGAVTYYARDKAYDKAADTIEAIMGKFPDMSPETLHEITTSATKNASAKSAQRLLDIHKMAGRKAANAKKYWTLKRQLRETPADKGLIRRYAELTAAGGNWDEALKNFAKLGGDMGKTAQNELDGNAPAESLADFWWDYAVQEAGAKDSIRQRAAMHYQSAIDSGALEGLKLVRAENRIAEVSESNPQATVAAKSKVEYKFNYRTDDNGKAFLCRNGNDPCVSPKPDGTVVCPESVDGHKVVGIDHSAFSGCDKMTRLVLPPHLEHLPVWVSGWSVAGAFVNNCPALKSMEIAKSNPKFITENGVLYTKDDRHSLLAYPRARTEIKLSPRTKNIEGDAFNGCTFKIAKLPDGIETVGAFVFSGCPNLEVVEFPKSVKSVNHRLVVGCPNIKKIVFHGDAPETYARHTRLRENIFYGASGNVVVEVERGTKGWAGPGRTDLPERWPLDGSDSRPIRYIQ